jgi:hypothetical protein
MTRSTSATLASLLEQKFKLLRGKRFVTRPLGRAPKFLIWLFVVVSIVIIIVSPAMGDNIDMRMRGHYFDTTVVLAAVGVDPDTTWTDAKT